MSATVTFTFVEEHLEFDVLVGGEDAAHPVEHDAAGAPELGAGGFHPANELLGGRFVGAAVGDNLRQLGLQAVQGVFLRPLAPAPAARHDRTRPIRVRSADPG